MVIGRAAEGVNCASRVKSCEALRRRQIVQGTGGRLQA
jgi:hypothetical protein